MAKHDRRSIGETASWINININLTLSKARGLFLEDNDNIDMKDTYKIIIVHPPIDEKDVVNEDYCGNNLLSSNNKLDVLIKKITELRKG